MDEAGEIQAEGQVNSEPQDIDAFLQKLGLEISTVGLEAGTLTQYLTYGLRDAGYQVVCMEARQVKVALSAMRNKTDQNDARGIAQLLRTGWYSPVYIKSIESHQIRALLSSRKAVLTKCVDLENEIRGLFKVFGIKLPPRLGHGSFDRAVLYHTFRELDNRTRKMAHQDPVCQRLMSYTGCGLCHRLDLQGRGG
jgi:transposase